MRLFHFRFPLSEVAKEWMDNESEWEGSHNGTDDDWIDDEESSSSDIDSLGPDEEQSQLNESSIREDVTQFSPVFDDSLLASMLSPMTINGPSSTGSDDLYKLLININELLHRVRRTIRLIRKSSLMESYVQAQMNNTGEVKQLVGDCHVRWNSTFLMIKRFLLHKDIITNITTTPDRIVGLNKDQKESLKKLFMSQPDWELLEALNVVLEPFVLATQVLSGRQYPTLGMGFFVYRTLEHFLSPSDSDPSVIVLLKQSLRYHFNVYFNTNLSEDQKKLMLVSIGHQYLSDVRLNWTATCRKDIDSFFNQRYL